MKKMVMITIALAMAAVASAQRNNAIDVLLGQGLHQEEVDGNCREAIKTFQRVVNEKNVAAGVAARAQLHIGMCQEKLGQREARVAYELLLSRYPDQTDAVTEARARIAALSGNGAQEGVRVRRLLADVYSAGGASRSGGMISYINKKFELEVFDVRTGASRRIAARLPGKSEALGDSVVSPDGRQVAYQISNFETVPEIRLVNSDGTQDRVLFTGEKEASAWPADWSADGREILAQHVKSDTRDLVMISVATGARKTIFTSQRAINAPTLSPDGRYIFYWDQADIFSIPVTGGTPIVVVDQPSNDRLIGFAPDGRLIFGSTRSGRRDVWAVRVQDGKAAGSPELILKDFEQKFPQGLSREGALFFSTNTEVAEVYTVEFNAAGRLNSGPTPISSRFVGVNTVPDYSRDGQLLAYVSGLPSSLQSDIRIRTVSTGQERSIPKPVNNVNQLRWYPDGKSLLVFGGSGAGPGFYRLDAETGASTKILDGIPSFAAVNPTFSPDGKYLYYEAQATPEITVLMRMDIATGTKQEVLRPPTGLLRIYSLSPDGSKIVYNWRKDSQDFLYLIPVTGGEPKMIHEVPKNEWRRGWGGLAWAADGRSVLYHREPDAFSTDELIRIPAEGGAPESVFTTGIIRRIAVHPDGRHITFEARTSSVDISVMENLFPRTR